MNTATQSDERARLMSVYPELFECMASLGGAYLSIGMQVRTKPLIGGFFGSGNYVLASHNCIHTGLDRVTYMVLEAKTWLAIGTGESTARALTQARSFLREVDPSTYARSVAELVVRRVAEREEQMRLMTEARAARLANSRANVAQITKIVPKRRQKIFDDSKGQCHYCGTALSLDGRWHIEHKMPKALMGGNEPSNLVASCAPCNHKKRDMTSEEFIARRSAA